MKKALKTLMLALLVVPCAFAFVGCGAKKINQAEFTKTVDAAYKYFDDQTFETSKDVTIASTSEISMTTVTDATADTGKTTTTVVQTMDYELKRAGKGENLVVEFNATTVTKTTVKVDALNETPASTTVTTETHNTKTTCCKLEDKFYEFIVTSGSTVVVVNGTKDNNASSETPESKTYAEISAEDYEASTGENSYLLAGVTSQLAAFKTPEEGAEDQRLEGTYTKDGKTVTGTFETYTDFNHMSFVANAADETPANNTTLKLTFKNDRITAFTSKATGTDSDGATYIATSNMTIKYSASITAPTSVEGYTNVTAA